jgi:hypothetical protein
MTRLPLRLAAGAAVAALLAAVPVSSAYAAGGWLRTRADETENATLLVSARADIAPDGMSVTWPLRFTCPAGAAYSFTLATIEQDPPLVPELRGEDAGIAAWGSASGTCTGHWQQIRPVLEVTPTTWVDHDTGEIRTELLPISATTFSWTEAILVGDGFYAVWCHAPACADTSGTRAVELR